MRRLSAPRRARRLVLAYPLLIAGSPVYQRLGALVLLAAIGASAWNIIGGYAGQVSVGHVVFFGCRRLCRDRGLHPFRPAADRRRSRSASLLSVC